LCAQLMRDLFAIAKFLLWLCITHRTTANAITSRLVPHLRSINRGLNLLMQPKMI